MSNFICKKCGSTEYEIKDKTNGTGIAHGLYCAKCGFWHKWLNKQELILYDKKDSKDEIIARLEAENAELKARLEKVEMALILSCSEIALLGICCQGCDNEENCRISFLDGGYQLKIKNCKKYWITKAEARLAELKKEK